MTITSPARSTHVPGLLRAIAGEDSGRPRLTWYGRERIELSGKVLENWAAKTANLLVDECDVEPGGLVLIDLPWHWKSAALALGAWYAGATVSTPGPWLDRVPEVAIGADPAALASSGAPVGLAVALPSLATRFPGLDETPAGRTELIDYAAEVRGHADAYLPGWDPAAGAAALLGPAGTVSHADLVPGARRLAEARGWPEGTRLAARVAGAVTGAGLVEALLAPLARDGSAVLLGEGAGPLERIAPAEGVTAVAGGTPA